MSNKARTNYNFSSVDLLIYMWNKKFILLIVSFLAAVTSIIVSFQITPKFKSSVIMFPATDASVSKSLLSANYSGRQSVYGFGEEEQAEQLLQILGSERIRSRIMEKYNLMEHYGIDPASKYPYTQLNAEYQSNISARRTELMSVAIEVLDKDPEVAAAIANDIAALVDTVYNEMKGSRSVAAYHLVEKEYLDAERNLALIQDTVQMLGNMLALNFNTGSGNNSGDVLAQTVKVLSRYGGTYMALAEKLKYETERLTDMRQRYQEARMEAEQNLSYTFIVDQAYASEKKAYPKKSVIVMLSTASAFLMTLILLIISDSLKERLAVKEED